ncbi:unnamed protein product, partial [Durusdinium trenchii]
AATITTQACVTHGGGEQASQCQVPHVDFDVSGLPCTDNSRAKRGRELEEGPTGPLFAIWALRYRRYRIPLGILENTPDLRVDVIHSLLGDLYNLHPILVDMDHCGHGGASRKRIYVIVVASKTQTKCLVDPITLYRALVEELHQRQTSLDCTTAPGDYLTADPMEIQLDAMEVARSSGKEFRSNCKSLDYLLTEREAKVVAELSHEYQSRYQRDPQTDEHLCVLLGDNPQWARTWSAVSGKVPTFRRNAAGKFWYPAHQRFLTSCEKHLASCSCF